VPLKGIRFSFFIHLTHTHLKNGTVREKRNLQRLNIHINKDLWCCYDDEDVMKGDCGKLKTMKNAKEAFALGTFQPNS
jgi:hypothetical protein